MDDDFWKKAGEAIDAQVKELAEKQAINTEKQLNEIHEAVRKEMKNETLIERLKVVGKYYNTHHDLFLLCREAVAEIERLTEELKKYTDSYNAAVSKSIRLGEQVEELEKSFPGYETVHINESEVNWGDLRDHIAIAAMEGTLSAQGWHPEYIIPAGGGHVGGQRAADAAAEAAYKYADAMLKAREK